MKQATWVLLVCLVTGFQALTASALPAGSGKPIRVNAEEMVPITFSNLLLRPLGTYQIDLAKADFTISILGAFRRAGHNVVGAENLLFGVDKSSKARMVLGGTINLLDCFDVRRYGQQVCDIAITWEVFDRRVDEVVYKKLTRFWLHQSRHRRVSSQEAHRLVLGALSSLLASDRFVELLKATDSRDQRSFPPATYRTCDARRQLPDQLQDLLEATVLIKVGESGGSGFFISPDGLLLTAAHVVDGVTAVEVTRRDGTKQPAVVVRRDKRADIALLKVEATTPCIPLAAEQAQAGAELWAVGAPLQEELAFSISRGIVSGLPLWEGNHFVQTDASINPGNSGGPLVNAKGEAIAVVSWKVHIPGFEGLGFGVPASTVHQRVNVQPGKLTTLSGEDGERKGGSGLAGLAKQPVVDTPDPHFDSPRDRLEQIHRENEERDRQPASVVALKLSGVALFLGGSGAALVGVGLLVSGKSTPAGVTLSVAGASLVTAIVLTVIGKKKEKKPPATQLSLAPAPSDNGVALSLGGTF